MSTQLIRWWLGIVASIGLLLFFLFQRIQWIDFFVAIPDPTWRFIANRTFRFFINDGLAVVLIYAIFGSRKYVIFACWVQLAGFIFLLIPYFLLKLHWPSYNGALINFLHRLILNPLLILLLIPAFFYQRRMNYRE